MDLEKRVNEKLIEEGKAFIRKQEGSEIIAKEGAKLEEEMGRLAKGWSSGHEGGLILDFGPKGLTPVQYGACGNHVLVYIPESTILNSSLQMSESAKQQEMKKFQVFLEVHSVGGFVPEASGIKVGKKVLIAGNVAEHPALVSDKEGFSLGFANFAQVITVTY